MIIFAIIALGIILCISSVMLVFLNKKPKSKGSSDVSDPIAQLTESTDTNTQGSENAVTEQQSNKNTNTSVNVTQQSPKKSNVSANATQSQNNVTQQSQNNESPQTVFDLFTYCKDFAIKKGQLNGDYTIYQQPASLYGGYENEYFSISYWAGSDMVEFSLHCPLSDTQSINFYLRMRGGYNKQYEYCSSKYYRDTGNSIRDAYGYIDPAVFYDGYPLSFTKYNGTVNGQTEFLEESRVGLCDLIRCLKKFVEVENMECSFSDFDFKHF